MLCYRIHEYEVNQNVFYDVQIYTSYHLGIFNHEFNTRRLRQWQINDYIKKLEMHGITRYY